MLQATQPDRESVLGRSNGADNALHLIDEQTPAAGEILGAAYVDQPHPTLARESARKPAICSVRSTTGSPKVSMRRT